MGAHFTTADDSGMGRWWDAEALAGEPQTALSEGERPFPADLLDEVDLDSLDEARLRYARRMAADAVDHLIALMDAIDALTEDMEPEDEHGDPLDDGEHDTADNEPSLGAPENHPGRFHLDMDDRYHVGRARHPLGDQTNWACGDDRDREDEHDGRESEAGYDLPEGDDERCASGDVDTEETLGWAANMRQVLLGPNTADGDLTAPERHGKGFVRCGPDDAEDDDPGEQDHRAYPADLDGLHEQCPAHVPALPWSVGGYVG